VDISWSSLEARIGRDGAASTFPNHAEGIAVLAALCHAHQVELVAMEATRGYEQQAFAQLSTSSTRFSAPSRGWLIAPWRG